MNPSGQDNVLGTANVKTLLRQLAIPAITAQVVNVLYNVVDRMYIGHIPDIGALALTGVGVCMPIIMLITAFAALVSMGSAPLLPSSWGEAITKKHIIHWATALSCSSSSH